MPISLRPTGDEETEQAVEAGHRDQENERAEGTDNAGSQLLRGDGVFDRLGHGGEFADGEMRIGLVEGSLELGDERAGRGLRAHGHFHVSPEQRAINRVGGVNLRHGEIELRRAGRVGAFLADVVNDADNGGGAGHMAVADLPANGVFAAEVAVDVGLIDDCHGQA